VVVGQYTDAGDVAINPHWDINRKHLEIRGCWGSDFSHFYRGIQVLAKHGHRFPYEGFISKIYRLEEMDQALADVEALKVVKAVVQP
jgi:L-iditol 2-dehydrogenase